MDTKLLFILMAVVLDGLAAFFGGLLPLPFIHRNRRAFLAFAAGTMLAVAFFELLPEAMESFYSVHFLMAISASGFCLFYLIEQFFGSHAAGQHGHQHHTLGPSLLLGDALHNISDGVAVAAAFMTDFHVGVVVTLAVFLHELPQEIGDFAILISQGYSRKKALFWLVLVQFTAAIGAIGAYTASTFLHDALPLLMAFSSGGFIYIAAADLLPQLRNRAEKRDRFLPAMFFAGVLVIGIFEFFLD